MHLVNKKINQLFKENHVEISYPQIDVHMKDADQKKRWLVTLRRIHMSPAPNGYELCERSFDGCLLRPYAMKPFVGLGPT